MRRMVTKALLDLNIEQHGTLVVHSSFKKMSLIGFQAEKVIEEIMEFMEGGTLAMPSMSWRICTPYNPFFDVLKTPSHVGVLSELFRAQYSTGRSLHPTHSMSVYGAN